MKNSFLLLASAILVSGCAVAYVEPADSASPTLLLENASKTHDLVNFATFDDGENCAAMTVKRITVNPSGDWAIEPGQSKKIRIKPEVFTLDASSGTLAPGTQHCKVLLTFTPKPNTAYVASFMGERSGCTLAINRIDESGNRIRENVRRRFSVAGIANNGNACK